MGDDLVLEKTTVWCNACKAIASPGCGPAHPGHCYYARELIFTRWEPFFVEIDDGETGQG